MTTVFGRASAYVQTMCYSATFFFSRDAIIMSPNKCVKFAPFGRPIRKSEALLLSAYAQR